MIPGAAPHATRYWIVEDSEEERTRDHHPLTRSVRCLLHRCIALLEIGVRRSFKIQCDFQQFKFECEDHDEEIDAHVARAVLLRALDPEGEVSQLALQHIDALIRRLRTQQAQEVQRLARTAHKEARAELAASSLFASQLQSVVRLPEADLRGVALQSMLVARRAVQSVDDLMVSQRLEWRNTPQQKAINKWTEQANEASSELTSDLHPQHVQRQALIYHALLCGDVELVGKLRVVDPTADINQTMEIQPPSIAPTRSCHYHSHSRAAGLPSASATACSISSPLRPSALSVLACDATRLWDATPLLALLSAGLDPTLPHPQLPHSSAIQVARDHLMSTGVCSGDTAGESPQGEQKESDKLHRSRVPPPPAHAVQTIVQARLVQLHQQHTFLVDLCAQWAAHSNVVLKALCESDMHSQETVQARAQFVAIIASYLDLQT